MSEGIKQTTTPFVSVIVPVYNDPLRIKSCIEALLRQTYPKDCYEVLIVDNGSTDSTRDVIGGYPVTLLVEDQIQSSYAARNKGIRRARGEIYAFTDSDCTPVPQWIEEGVRALLSEGADLAGGKVRFVYSSRPTGAEIFDSVSHLQMEQGIRERNVAKTANVFARKSVVDSIGLFPEHLQSGGDIYWTKRATTNGFKLIYAPRAEVAHPTRRLQELLKKQYRVGRGHRGVRAIERKELEMAQEYRRVSKAQKMLQLVQRRLVGVVSAFLPLPMSFIQESIERNEIKLTPAQFLRVWLVSWIARMTVMIGRLSILRVRQ